MLINFNDSAAAAEMAIMTTLVLYLSIPFLSISAANSVSTTRDHKGNVSPASKCTNVYNYYHAGNETNLGSLLGEMKAQLNVLQDTIDDLTRAITPGRDKRGSEGNPGQSCKEIRNSGDFTTSGIYWLKPEGSSSRFQAYCDMSAIGRWKRVRLDQIDSTITGGVTLTYAEQNNGLTISVRVLLNGCGSTPNPGALTYIKGYWTKIKYTETFTGTTSCWSIFGDDWYGRSSVNHAEIGVHKFRSSQGDVITNQYYMGGDSHTFDGKVRRCDNDPVKNFWRNSKPSERRATVVLRRKLHAEKAGIFTGTGCGKPFYKISDIYVYY